jgi:hypothetical protein
MEAMTAALNAGQSLPSTYDAEERVIIALDFGTTFSGVAYCFPNKNSSRVATVVNWPGTLYHSTQFKVALFITYDFRVGIDGESHNAPKVQTVLNYGARGLTWGASVDPLAENIVGVKLLLDPSQEKPLYLPTGSIKNDLRKLPKTPVGVAADFIGAIYQHALKDIASQVPESYMSLCQKQFVLSGYSALPRRR